MTDAAYRTVAAFTAQLAALGVTDAVISPGSRSTPLTLCFDAQPGMRTWIQLDERSAGFFALGMGRASGRPAVLVCTSGTAAANYLPAVVEASHAGIPMIVCTADRPPELRGWGSPQTIDQVDLYGTAARWSTDLPVPDEAGPGAAAGWAERAVASASGRDPGPVHLNWPLREPLEPSSTVAVLAVSGADIVSEPVAGDGDRGQRAGPPRPAAAGDEDRDLSAGLSGLAGIVAECERGVVVAGPWPGGGMHRELRWASEARRFAAWAGWPLLGEPISHVRGGSPGVSGSRSDGSPGVGRIDIPACVVATADHLLADETLGEALRPDAAVLVGRTATTKPVRLWLERTRPRHVVLIDPEDRWKQAVFRLTGHVPASAEALSSITSGAVPPGRGRDGGWLDTWSKLDRAARNAIAAAIADHPLLSARAARDLVDALPADAVLVATNSLPVRDLDAFVFDAGPVTCLANRGAAGIDGSASTALGVAAADPSATVALYTGDLALLHDLSGLAAADRLGLHLTAVCVDNDGGEIFSLLPVADRIAPQDFERLFRTPHRVDLCGLDGFAGIRAARVSTSTGLRSAVSAAASTRAPGVDLLVVDIDRDDDVAQRRALTAAAQQAARQALAAVQGHD
ncbi:MAG: 2-succinyl-5-enolpyruvyl-6-hydroxy-3-cyclohexene-1-carboxylic-acid synthase [Acidimicrobiaceae bacterium]|nr:2-succinyl-5-enolpyruvyl-6-hydroxy-3-cyclohexene-1-carboxylic-acid synthase [Acidimicrobiaceae bacterium]MYE98043.1 2-succinyl-5-enolpyruvyl-6-hydroxy-3-cyclohexene-1-carboxylic-acid synthase [Acidimicrobiaceae bacterium]MYH44807.1 2-succinyl-5-enolpyruvyl-6-hydroxy-3-cyclohexene-1-carboxylic-acid synthase [Acidimicrobiaceae bacterium]MYI53672.1 2-succinyl-5-enolpyruvyl-6-hydroxy-3-cyclohexene-1-carboxylic-acid synthase [Acidimicrobiaceae bacterium]